MSMVLGWWPHGEEGGPARGWLVFTGTGTVMRDCGKLAYIEGVSLRVMIYGCCRSEEMDRMTPKLDYG
jgi:hypothetical protein